MTEAGCDFQYESCIFGENSKDMEMKNDKEADIRAEELISRALKVLPFSPTEEQTSVLRSLAGFIVGAHEKGVFVLNGYAGTGKTSIVGAMIKAMDSLKRKVVVLAPTGRGANVASRMSAHPASTIHRRLYRPDLSDPSGRHYVMSRNESGDTLFIIDEASLISDGGNSRDTTLLSQVVNYVYSAPGCRMMLMGDDAQLPPVGQSSSSAMDPDRLRALGLEPVHHVLDLPMRQTAESGIIYNATYVRHLLLHPGVALLPKIHATGFDDVRIVDSRDLPDMLSESYSSVGKDETLIITRANWRANDFNKAIRRQVFDAESPLERGDRIVITKNDYYWAKRNKAGRLIANGDMAEVTWTGATEKMYGRYFTEVELLMADGRTLNAQLMLRSLVAEGASIPRDEMDRFYNIVMANSEGTDMERITSALENPYYNALQAKYAYCVTGHKAQGGEWKHVYIDMGGISADAYGPDFYRWLYTAITRATERVIFINPSLPVV